MLRWCRRSKIFHWFSVDFGGSHTTWLNRIRQWLARGIELQNDDGGGVPEQHRVSHVTAAQALLKNLCHLQGIEFRTQEGADKAVGEAATAQANKVPAVKFVCQNCIETCEHAFNSKNYVSCDAILKCMCDCATSVCALLHRYILKYGATERPSTTGLQSAVPMWAFVERNMSRIQEHAPSYSC